MRFAGLVLLGMLGISSLAAQGTAALAGAKALGFDEAKLAAFDADIASGKYGNVDSLLVMRHGKVALDRRYAHDYATIYAAQAKAPGPQNPHDPSGPYNYFNPWWHPFYRGGDLHSEQSVSKTVTSVVVGTAVSRHEFPPLDTPVMEFFDESKVANVDERKRHMTLRNLLTMTTGLKWQDDLPYSDPNNAASIMEASEDWVKFVMDQPMAEEPGTSFYYNDGAPVVMAYIFRKVTGQDMEEYAAKYLFAPLGIEHWYWKRIPYGVVDAEGGVYLEAHELAKIMLLFQQKGMWNGKQVVSAEWVKESLAPSYPAGKRPGTFYGYAWWLYQYGKDDPRLVFGGSGFGGQVPLVIPDYDIVIVVNAWNVNNGKGLGARVVIDTVLAAVADGKK